MRLCERGRSLGKRVFPVAVQRHLLLGVQRYRLALHVRRSVRSDGTPAAVSGESFQAGPGADEAVQHPHAGWFERVLGMGEGVASYWAVLLIAFLLADCWGIVYAIGGTGRVAPHFFYLPILFAAIRFGLPGALLAGVASAILAGPAMPLDTETGEAQVASDWVSRGVFFLVIGGLFATMVSTLRRAWSRQLDVAERERELATYKSDLLQTFSHEMRTPLTVILGTARTLEARRMVADDGVPLLDGMVKAASRLEEMINLTLAAAQPREGNGGIKLGIFEIRPLLMAVCSSLQTMNAIDRVKIEGPPRQKVTSDPDVLSLILRALLENALKFSPPESAVAVRYRQASDALEMSIRDEGPGISKMFVPRAFEPFTQGDPSLRREHGGLGIGLYAARKLAEEIGARVEVVMTSPQGTEILIRIPN